jgi:methylmalonyl-CoA mutase
MNIKPIEKRINAITQREGRRPRILLAHLESDQSDRWTKPLAASLAEFGFDVDIGPGNQAPLQSARLAIDNDVHVMCVSIVDSTNQPLVVQLADALQAQGGANIRLVAGGVGVQPNHEELYRR